MEETAVATKEAEKETIKKRINVGLIMPIAEIAGLGEQHWEDVRRIITESLKGDDKYDMNIRLVSHSDEVRVIQTSIVQNIYKDDIVIIDVSAKNANVMFEFGMRLAFDKPFVVIKDNATPYIFDTGNIQHLEYPRDLRYTQIENFKETLKKKVISTLEYALNNTDVSMYLEQYGNLKPSKIEEQEVDITEYFERALGSIRKDFKRLEGRILKENVDKKVDSIFFTSNYNNNNDDLFNLVRPIVQSYFEGSAKIDKDVYYSDDLLNVVIENMYDRNIKYSPNVLKQVTKQAVDSVSADYLPF